MNLCDSAQLSALGLRHAHISVPTHNPFIAAHAEVMNQEITLILQTPWM